MIFSFSLTEQNKKLETQIQQAISQVIEGGAFILGKEVSDFEDSFADYLKVPFAVGCNSGTDALYMALRSVSIGQGDEVITSAFSFFASAGAISMAGATPVFVDIEKESFNVNPHLIEKAITKKTKAVLIPHLFGQSSQLALIKEICDKHNLIFIEDCAQSLGATFDNKQSGTVGHIGCYSFFPTKNLGCFGDGGAVATQDSEIYENLKKLRNHGSSETGVHTCIGFNSRLDSLQAAILKIKLPHLPEYIKNRQAIAKIYDEHITAPSVKKPQNLSQGEHTYNQYTILHEKRDELMSYLKEKGVPSRIYYNAPIPDQSAMKEISRSTGHEVTKEVCNQCLSLPIYPEFEKDNAKKVAQVVNEFCD